MKKDVHERRPHPRRALRLGGLLALLGVLGGCPSPGTRQYMGQGSLKNLMKNELNPTFTEVSFWLFHNREAGSQDRFDLLARNAESLQAKSEGLLQHRPPYYADRMADYEEHAISLHHYAVGLRQAALEKNMPECILWFTHVKNACFSCHRTYRFGEDPPIRSR